MIVRIDIETVPLFATREEWEESDLSRIWIEKYCNDMDLTDDAFERYRKKSSLFPEFSKICCISLAYQAPGVSPDGIMYKTKSFAGKDEWQLLSDFQSLMWRFNKWRKFWGHNIKQFDLPFISKRMVINGFILPDWIDFWDKKPREIDVVDTMDVWSFGRRLNSGLDLMCVSLGVPTPKQTLTGDQVKDVYLADDIGRIATYCEADVVATAQCYDRIIWGSLTKTATQSKLLDASLSKEISDTVGEISPYSVPDRAWKYFTGLEDVNMMTSEQKARYLQYYKEYSARSDLTAIAIKAAYEKEKELSLSS